MMRDYFRVLHVDLTSGEQHYLEVDGRTDYLGGSGLAALLYCFSNDTGNKRQEAGGGRPPAGGPA